jgi:hypothetical protein
MDGAHIPIDPLHVEIGGTARYRQARTVADLAGMLTSSTWTGAKGAPFHRALVASLEALELRTEAEAARATFVAAAHAAGMHVLPDDKGDDGPSPSASDRSRVPRGR